MSTIINPNTGSIRLPGYRRRIKAGMTLEEFQASPLSADVRPDQIHKRHCWFYFRQLNLNGAPFLISILFTDGVIDYVDLTCADDRYGKSWKEWSEKKELSRKAFHERWLRKNLGPKPLSTAYSWGGVESYYDARSGGSSISIRYGRPK